MIHRPDDQVLDYFSYQCRVGKCLTDVEKFQNGYQYWLSRKDGVVDR